MPFDAPRVPPPPRPKTTTDIVSDHEREKRRTQRPVTNHATARRIGGSFKATVAVPANVAIPLPQGCEEVIVWTSFTASEEGASSVLIGALGVDEFTYGSFYFEGAGAPPYVWPNDGKSRIHTVYADIRGDDGPVAGFVTVTAFIR